MTDQLAMARMARGTYALMVALLPAIATVVGILVLAQIPSAVEIAGVALVVVGVAVHRPQAVDGAELVSARAQRSSTRRRRRSPV